MERHVVVAYVARIQTLERWLQEKLKKKGADVGTFQYHGPRKLNACQSSSEIAHIYGIILDVISVVQCFRCWLQHSKNVGRVNVSTRFRVFVLAFPFFAQHGEAHRLSLAHIIRYKIVFVLDVVP
jgi:hypothetical protein